MSCVELECSELHVSFVDISRIAFCPSVVKWRKVEEMFAECNSPLLTEIYSTCAFKERLLYDLIDRRKVIHTRKSYKYLTFSNE